MVFCSGDKKGYHKRRDPKYPVEQPKFVSGSKVSFVTDDEEIYESIKEYDFPLLSIYLSAVKVIGQEIEQETSMKTSLASDITICNEDKIRPYCIES